MLNISSKPSYIVSVAGELSGEMCACNVTKTHPLKSERILLKRAGANPDFGWQVAIMNRGNLSS